MKTQFLLLLSITLFLGSCIQPKNNEEISLLQEPSKILAPKPPLGWNSYDAYHGAVTEKQTRQATDSLAKKLLPYGYDHVVVDFCWFNPGPEGWDPNNWKTFLISQTWEGDSVFSPTMAMDEFGRLLPATNRFPSAKDGVGFKALSDYVHSKGMKFGIHIIRGVPRQAVALKTRVKGTNYTAADIIEYTPSSWTNVMHKVDIRKPGAQEYYNSIFDLYAQWGVDYVKADDISRPIYHPGEVEMMHNAIEQCGREIVLSLSWGGPSMGWANHIVENADLWRISGDFWDEWEDIYAMFELASNWCPFRGNGNWPDCDMLPIGQLCLSGYPKGNRDEHRSHLTDDEIKTMMNLWCMARSPLMWGGDPISTSDEDYAYLTNEMLLDINQNSCNNKEVFYRDNRKVWTAEDSDSEDKYLGLFNVGEYATNVDFDRYWVKWEGEYELINVWTGENEGKADDIISKRLEPHASVVYKLVKL